MRIKNRIVAFFRKIPLPLKNYILFESVPDLSDNTKAVYDEMIRREINKRFKLVWVVNKKSDSFPSNNNTLYVEKNNRIKIGYYRLFSKCVICCNDFFKKCSKKQITVYLCHGLGIKKCSDYYRVPNEIDYVISPADGVVEVVARQLKTDVKKIVPLGYPRNDVLCGKPSNRLHNIFDNMYSKIIIWYPTFRKHSSGKKFGGEAAVPIIHNLESAEMLNEVAKNKNALIIVKLHFAQDVSSIIKLNLSNVIIINDSFLKEHDISSYELLKGSDALITDYSSVFFDYLLCNNPIALVWEDIEEYRLNPGFDIDFDTYLSGAAKVYNIDELICFVNKVVDQDDEFSAERNKIKDLTMFSDGKSSKRVADFIMSKIS